MSLPIKPLTAEQALRRRCQRMLADQRRRAKVLGAELSYGLDDLLALVRAAKVCHYCGAPLALDLQCDHATPIARGGKHSLDNLRAVCRRCNELKSTMTQEEYLRLRAFLKSLHPVAADNLEKRLLHGGRLFSRNRKTAQITGKFRESR